LPGFLKPSPRYLEERQRLSDAEACLRAATRHAEMARFGHLDAAWTLLEAQMVLPFEHLVSANDCHVEDGNASFLSEWEEEALRDYAMQARAWRKARQLPKWSELEAADITRLLALFPEGLKTEPRDLSGTGLVPAHFDGDDCLDWTPVIEAALRDIALPVRAVE
jgi:hypothetical protein